MFQGCSHSESPKSHQSLFPAPNGRGWSRQNALDRCHLRFSERGQSRRARRNKGDFLYCWYVLGVSGCRAGIPSPGKSHGHVKEHDDGKKSEISFLPLYNDALSLELRKFKLRRIKCLAPRLYHSRRAELDVGPGSCLMVHSVTSCFQSFSSLVKLKGETLERWPITKQQVCPEHFLHLSPMNMPCRNGGEKTY